jgi:hypothetical protein
MKKKMNGVVYGLKQRNQPQSAKQTKDTTAGTAPGRYIIIGI